MAGMNAYIAAHNLRGDDGACAARHCQACVRLAGLRHRARLAACIVCDSRRQWFPHPLPRRRAQWTFWRRAAKRTTPTAKRRQQQVAQGAAAAAGARSGSTRDPQRPPHAARRWDMPRTQTPCTSLYAAATRSAQLKPDRPWSKSFFTVNTFVTPSLTPRPNNCVLNCPALIYTGQSRTSPDKPLSAFAAHERRQRHKKGQIGQWNRECDTSNTAHRACALCRQMRERQGCRPHPVDTSGR